MRESGLTQTLDAGPVVRWHGTQYHWISRHWCDLCG